MASARTAAIDLAYMDAGVRIVSTKLSGTFEIVCHRAACLGAAD
ncbi:hypothetical protein [Bradyrhizobium sp. BWC-3-1]|nr:hypothetical protein [Bradyrhizobium sp. BWC-3-1]WOH60282.1 hypothetical protein RX329_09340 [Bradyrhizobium sp. BWC-3-1]